ncbi:Zinc finger protein 567like [Caligus rogercresseyi]|uniref:Zinc finger protein 567like n=1 Tax=Caligus rogercresseyi TaxID=217165 RepID=A0A7T8KGR2_CALRO|nr:Zinc finger protein 567like [Caligus rogercresseyi]
MEKYQDWWMLNMITSKRGEANTRVMSELKNELCSLRNDIYLTEISEGKDPRLKIVPWWFQRLSILGGAPTPEELSAFLSSLQEASACPGIEEDVILDNVDQLQVIDLFLFYIEASGSDCRRLIYGKGICEPCKKLLSRIDPNEAPEEKVTKKTYRAVPRILPMLDLPNNTSFVCPVCNTGFRFGNPFVEHLFHVHSCDPNKADIQRNELSLIKCPSCPECLDGPLSLERHRSESHAVDPHALITLEAPQRDSTSVGSVQSYSGKVKHGSRSGLTPNEGEKWRKRCNFCPRFYSNKHALARHIRECHAEEDLSEIDEVNPAPKEKSTCDQCGKDVLDVRKHKANAHPEKVIFKDCHICGKSVKRGSIANHLLTHKKESWVCSYCGKSFPQKAYLATHVRRHDPGYKSTPCKLCDKLFKGTASLYTHMQSVHMGKRDHMCNICGKAFFTKAKLNRHIPIHSKIKDLHCELCSYACSRRDRINQHRLIVHGIKEPQAENEKNEATPIQPSEEMAI